jgi:multidrug transporter EmrE-like cation transporter
MILAVVGQLFLKKGVLASQLSLNINAIISTIFSPITFLGFFFYGVSSIFWLFVLQKFPLSIAYPALSLTYVAIVTISVFVFKEPITTSRAAGIVLIMLGVFILFR